MQKKSKKGNCIVYDCLFLCHTLHKLILYVKYGIIYMKALICSKSSKFGGLMCVSPYLIIKKGGKTHMRVEGLVLVDAVRNLGSIMDKVIVTGCDERGLTVEFELRGIRFCTRFAGDGMCYTKKAGCDEEWMFDDHSNTEFLTELKKHFI